MYKPGNVLDFLNKDKEKEIEDSGISSLFKDESELSQIFHRNKMVEAHKHEGEDGQHKNSISSNPLIGEEDEEVDDKGVVKLSNAGRRIDGKRHKEMLRGREEQDTRTVFVGNVPLNSNKKDLMDVFRKCGKIESIRFRSVPIGNTRLPKKAIAIKKAYHPRGKAMNAYVVFERPEMLQEALALNNCELHGVHLRVDSACQKKQICHDRSIFIGNLPYNCDDESLRGLFGECGEVEGVRVVRDKTTSVGKGFAYVAFKEEASVALALRMDGCEMKKRKLRVQRSSNKPPRKKGVVAIETSRKKGVVAKETEAGRRMGRSKIGQNKVEKKKGEKKKGEKNKFDENKNMMTKQKSKNQNSDKMKFGKNKSDDTSIGDKNIPGRRQSLHNAEDAAPNKKKVESRALKRKVQDVPQQSKKSRKEVLKKKQDFLVKKQVMVEKKKKIKKVIKQKILKNKKAKLGEILSKQ